MFDLCWAAFSRPKQSFVGAIKSWQPRIIYMQALIIIQSQLAAAAAEEALEFHRHPAVEERKLTWTVTWHRMSSFTIHVSVCALLAVDLDNSKGGSGFGRFSKGHDVR